MLLVLSTKVGSELFPYCGELFGENVTLTGEAKENGNQLSWVTIAENDIVDYEIQRSKNITDFVTIGTVKANGSSSYEFLDASPFLGKNPLSVKIDSAGWCL